MWKVFSSNEKWYKNHIYYRKLFQEYENWFPFSVFDKNEKVQFQGYDNFVMNPNALLNWKFQTTYFQISCSTFNDDYLLNPVLLRMILISGGGIQNFEINSRRHQCIWLDGQINKINFVDILGRISNRYYQFLKEIINYLNFAFYNNYFSFYYSQWYFK